MHLSTVIDNINNAVTSVKLAHNDVLVKLMQNENFTSAQKLEIVELLNPISDAISIAQSKFEVTETEAGK